MSRYLNPGKVALLCLVELYAESRFPNQSILPVLSFVLKHIVNPKDSSCFIVTLEQIKSATVNEPSAVVGRNIFDLLLKKLWEINSLDALHTLFTILETYLVDTEGPNRSSAVRVHGEKSPLSRSSVLGCFVRRAALEHTRMTFTDSIMLWKSFIVFREPTLPEWRKRNLGAGPLSFDINLKGLTLEDPLFDHVYGRLRDSRECHISTDDVERLLEFQVDIMQSANPPFFHLTSSKYGLGIGTRIPGEVQEQLRTMLDLNVTIPSLSHYVEFLNSWRAGDYAGAFDNLHRYFDYTMQNRDRTFYQYALLNLAILQADFSCYRESVLAMQETVNTARENKDIPCLNFALSWFYHFHKAHPQDCPEIISSRMERESLQFLKAKAKDAGMHHLQSMAHLSEAKQLLVGGESIPAAFESILRSSHLNVTKNIHNAMGSQSLLQSAIWSRLGITYLSWMSCELFLAKYRQQAPIEDVIKALCRSAYIISMRGRFDEALERLEEMDQESLRTLKVYQYWSTYIGLLKLRRAIHKGDVASADILLEHLAASPSVEPDCAIEISLSRIDLQMRRGNFSVALACITNLADELVRDKADIYHRIRLMTLKAQLLAKCGRAPKGLSLALRAAAISWRSRLLPMLFQSLLVISAILIDLAEFKTAYDLMDRIMPQVLECEDALLNAQCFSVLADSLVGLAGRSSEGERREELHRALEFLDRAGAEFARLGDGGGRAGAMGKKARIMDYLGDGAVRDEVVKLYIQLKKRG